MKKILIILFILCLNNISAQFTRIQDLTAASKLRGTDLFLLTQDTTFDAGLNFKSRRLTANDLWSGFGYKSSRVAATNGKMIIGASSRIDSVFSQHTVKTLYTSGGNLIKDSGINTVQSTRLKAFVRFEAIAGLGGTRFRENDLLESIVIRPPVPPLTSYTTKLIQATVTYTNGDLIALLYEADREDTLKIGDIFYKVGSLVTQGGRNKTILLDSESGEAPYIAGWDDINSFEDWNDPLLPKFAVGNLNRFTDPIFGDSLGYGILTTNFYGSGGLALSGASSDTFLSGVTDDIFVAYGDKIGFWKGSESAFRTYMEDDGSIYASGTDTTSALFHFDAPNNLLRINGNVNINSGTTFNQIGTNTSNITTNSSNISINSDSISSNVTSINFNQGNITTNTSNISQNASNINLRVAKDSVISSINISSEGIDIEGDNIQLTGSTTIDGSFTLNGDALVNGTVTTAKLDVDSLSAIVANLGTVTAGNINASNVNITNIDATNITSGIFSTTGGAKFGTDVSSTKDGLYINADNYILDDNSFRLGGATGITYSGTGSIGIGSNIVVDGAVFASNTIDGTTTIGGTGSVVTGATSTRMELIDDGLFAYNAGTVRAKIGNDGSGFFGASDKFFWDTSGNTTISGLTIQSTSGNDRIQIDPTGDKLLFYKSGALLNGFFSNASGYPTRMLITGGIAFSGDILFTNGTNFTSTVDISGITTFTNNITFNGGGASKAITLNNTANLIVAAASGGYIDAPAYKINGAATSGTYLRGNGTSYVSSTIGAVDMPSAIDAVKLADGTVSNTEFQYINSVTSNVQTQIDSKQATLTWGSETDTVTPYYVATSSGGSPTTKLKFRNLTINGTTVKVLVEEDPE